MKTIAIIGGGFSGTLTAINLARFSDSPLRICLVNHRHPVGRGVAYSTRHNEHLLNVAARNMSALPDHPGHFLEWLRTRSEYADLPEQELREVFVPRQVYGDYLRGLLLWHSQPIEVDPAVQIEIVHDEVVDIFPCGEGAAVVLAGGREIEADKALLATGNQPPADWPSSAAAFHHPQYVANPWEAWEHRLPDRDEPVVLLGAGLTMIDVFLTLNAHGWQGPLTAVSRHGLLPLSHFKGIEYADFPPADVSHMRLGNLVELVEDHCARLQRRGVNPAIIVDKFRPHTQHVWQNFSLAEKREFFRRYGARWNATRHRVAQQIHEQVAAAVADGSLLVVKGAIRDLHSAGQKLVVTVDDAGGGRRTIAGGLVVNCTGPQASVSAAAAPLLKNLLRRGLVRADEMDMGIEVEADFAVVDRGGDRSPILFAMGSLLKGTLWETTAVPELRGQAFRVAQILLDEVHAERGAREAWSYPFDAEVLEYCI